MSEKSDKEIAQQLEHLVLDEHKYISYKWVTNHFQIPIERSKQLITQLSQSNQSKLQIYYCVSGIRQCATKNDNSSDANASATSTSSSVAPSDSNSGGATASISAYSFVITSQSKLEAIKQSFSKVFGSFIYSVAPQISQNGKEELKMDDDIDTLARLAQLQISDDIVKPDINEIPATDWSMRQYATDATQHQKILTTDFENNSIASNTFSCITNKNVTRLESAPLSRVLRPTPSSSSTNQKSSNKFGNKGKSSVAPPKSTQNKRKKGSSLKRKFAEMQSNTATDNSGSPSAKRTRMNNGKAVASASSTTTSSAEQSQSNSVTASPNPSKKKDIQIKKPNSIFSSFAKAREINKNKPKSTPKKQEKKTSEKKKTVAKKKTSNRPKPAQLTRKKQANKESPVLNSDLYGSESSDDDMDDAAHASSDEEAEELSRQTKSRRNNRRKNQALVDSDDDELMAMSGDDDDDADDKPKKPKKPTKKEIKAAEEAAKAEKIKARFFSGNGSPTNSKRRKTVTRTFMDDEGCLVTEDVTETDDEASDPISTKAENANKENGDGNSKPKVMNKVVRKPKPSAKPAPTQSKGKQGNIMSFFGKK